MCGIAGVFLPTPGTPEASLRRLLAAIRHRGHSQQEIGGGPTWALGANRLQIVDPDNGRQPFRSADGAVTVVFNGEIYNHRELRRELEAAGYVFLGHCDTEVLAHGYHRWGRGIFDRLDGMFAILLHDARSNDYFGVRDPLGVKPLYAVSSAHGDHYASEIKSLLDIPGTIAEVTPGHARGRGGLETRYARPVPGLTPPCDTFGRCASSLAALLRAAVGKRVATDLPVAVFLSGGIDSTAVMYEAARAHPEVTAFSIGLDDSTDARAARRFCAENGMRHEHVQVSWDELLSAIPEVIWTIESFEPNHVRGGTLSYLLSREVARRGYRVALCGEGADELFAGYAEVSAALRQHTSPDIIETLLDRFVAELHRTQLQRIDRTSMRFALEMREPFLDKAVVSFAQSLPLSYKVGRLASGAVENKRVLRQAYRACLPAWVAERGKVVLSQGAGFGSNGPEGPFFEHALEQVSEGEFAALAREHAGFHLRNREEAYYFGIFRRRFGDLPLAMHRPMVNSSPAEH